MFFREIDRTLFPARPLIHMCVRSAAAPNSFFNKDQRTYPTMFFGGGDPFEHFAGMHGGPGGPGGTRGGPRKDVDTTALYDTLGVSLSFRSAWSGGHGPQTWHCTVGISTGSREQKFDRDRRRISGPIRENGNGTEGRGQASADLLAVGGGDLGDSEREALGSKFFPTGAVVKRTFLWRAAICGEESFPLPIPPQD